ncbi:indolepyruvate ferredoxin oxidoreductase subunit alpha [Sporohalobacter salinus]|uniref:indolepyruvate ferredoxin oxidoreductase subunit alpha n=1 Tax=Sporohalobacter salinus TaxID=1494606 RepID=UPI00196067BC|nr:indolepyruvate ferredoxin oxidoreductase subunit alpha [Sporohalobacter salinus]MBM7624419.1 indolepyruvate ferredoxin oxidoreductase alpha subunit [Sporohalobacter salinus]
MAEELLLSGNEAIARGAYEAGVRVATAYPGTPSTEILENIVDYKEDIYCQWSPNEKVAMEVAIGAAFGGVRTLVAMKHVGLNVAADPFMTLSYTGVRGGLVIVTADDPSMHSSQNEQDNRHYARFAKVPMLEPSDSQEAKDFVGYALDISEEFDTPVILRVTTRISHAKTVVEPAKREEQPVPEEFEKDPEKFVMVPANARKRHPIVEDRLEKISQYGEEASINQVEKNSHQLGVITSGISYNYVKEVFSGASILKLGLSYPLPKQKIKNFAKQVDKIYVIEELDPFLENQIKAMGIEVIGKDKLPAIYEFNTKIIRDSLLEEQEELEVEPVEDLPPRPPALCPGCPHRGVFYTLNKLGVAVTGDIGCYALGVVPPLSAMDTVVCMGASVGNAFGMELALGDKIKGDIVGVIGDSTFMHSGITGLIDIMYNKGASTIVILDNRITAMTGHQENPVTGKTLMDEETVCIDLAELSTALGVKEENVRTIDPYHLKATNNAIKEELAKDEISIVVAQRSCALLKSVDFKEPYYVDSDKCKDCGQCLDLGCPAIVKEDGKAKINDYLCTGCGVCTQVCSFDAIVREGDNDE